MHIAMGAARKNVRKRKQIKKKPLTWRKVSLHEEKKHPLGFLISGGGERLFLPSPPMHIA